MPQTIPTETEIAALNVEYEHYISRLRIEWLARNRPRSRDVYEVMSPAEQEEVHRVIAGWSSYVTPLAEAWWKARGYGVIWPDVDSEPMRVYKLPDS